MSQEEILLDIEELAKLQQLAERPRVKDILAAEIEKLKSPEVAVKPQTVSNEVNDTREASATAAAASSVPAVVTSGVTKSTVVPKYYKDITTYAWDQSEKFLKVYVTVNGVQKLSKENITTEFKNKSFRLRVENLDNSNYQCHVAFLWDDIVPADSYYKVKTDSILLMLKKAQERKTWAYVTEREDKKKKTGAKPDEKKEKDPNEGLMDMLKQMYEDGDDEMKRTIAKSFSESKTKKPDEI
jgi:calcyclin binding protein